jgi:signal transduction histidine kinase
LRASSLGPSGLVSTLRLLIDELSSSSQVKIVGRFEDIGGSPWIHLLIYHIAREALRNAVQHAGATEVLIELFEDSGDAQLVVRDNGRGFDPGSVDLRDHFGLQMMRERAELAGGVLHVYTEPGKGTQVASRLPLLSETGATED